MDDGGTRWYCCVANAVSWSAVRASHGDDDLSASASRVQIADGVRDLAQRIGPVDDRRDLAGFDELCQDLQVAWLRAPRTIGQPLAHERVTAARPGASGPCPPIHRPPLFAADETSRPVGARARRSCDSERLPPMSRIRSYRCPLRVKSSSGVVDDMVGAERADQVHLRGAAHAGHLGAERFGDLHGEQPHAARRPDDQDPLP